MADMKTATWVVCPMCDEEKCVGRFNCPQIKAWLLKHEEGDNNG